MLRLITLAVVSTVSISTGTAAGIREKLLEYTKLDVAQLKNKVGDNLEKSVVDDLQRRIVNGVNEGKVSLIAGTADLPFPKRSDKDEDQLDFQGTGADSDSKTVILFTEIITFNKGSRAKRYMLGGGTGRAELRGNCYIVDKKTGKQLYNFQTFGETNWGLMGGGADKTLKGFAGRIVGFLQGKY